MTQITHSDSHVLETVREVVDNAAAGKVFGAPIMQDGVTVLPVAKVSGGGGGGSGTGPSQEGKETGGTGGGMGVAAKPLGVFVIRKGRVRWQPALDMNKVIIGGQIVGVIALLTLRAMIQARGRRLAAKYASARVGRALPDRLTGDSNSRAYKTAASLLRRATPGRVAHGRTRLSR